MQTISSTKGFIKLRPLQDATGAAATTLATCSFLKINKEASNVNLVARPSSTISIVLFFHSIFGLK